MSNAGGSTRSRAEPERGPANALAGHTRSKGGARVNAKDRPLSSGEVNPEDSASNAGGGSRQSFRADSHRTNGSISTILGKRTERVRETTREKLQVRTRSPVKTKARGVADGKDVRSVVPSRQGSQNVGGGVPAQMAKKTLRMLTSWLYLNAQYGTAPELLTVNLI